MTNPLFSDYVVPPFSEIREEHFIPALKEVVETARLKFEEMRDNSELPNFQNSVAPFDTLFEDVNRDLHFLEKRLPEEEIAEKYRNFERGRIRILDRVAIIIGNHAETSDDKDSHQNKGNHDLIFNLEKPI
jgi:Zn-dependent oligopeptidase